MSKMKIYELAKEIGKQSKDVVTFLNNRGFSVKNHLSNIEDNAISEVKKHYNSPKTNEPKPMTQSNIPMNKKPVKVMQENRGVNQNLNNNQSKTYQNEKQADQNKSQGTQTDGNNNNSNANNTHNNTVNSSNSSNNSNNNRTNHASGTNGSRYNNNRSTANNTSNNANRSTTNNNRNTANNNANRSTSNNGGYSNNSNTNNNRSTANNGGYSNNTNNNRGTANNGGYSNNTNNNRGTANNGGYSNNTNNNRGTTNNGGYSNNTNNNRGTANNGGYSNNTNNNRGTANNGGYSNNTNNNRGTANNGGYSNNTNNNRGTANNGGYSNNTNNNRGTANNGGYSNNTNNNRGTANNGGYSNNTNNNRGTANNGGYSNNTNNNRGTANNGGYGNNTNNNRGTASNGGYGNNANRGNTSGGGYNNNNNGNSNNRSGAGNKQSNRFGGNNRNGQRSNRINQSYQASQKRKDPNRKGAFIQPVIQQIEEETVTNIIIPEILTMKELADKMKMSPAAIVKKLFLKGIVATINQELTFEEAEEIAMEFDIIAELEEQVDVIEELLKEDDEDETTMLQRPPVVCVMGHVDHGKTSLLDAIRKTSVTEKEAGGITQQIGAYVVKAKGEGITFLDTPGHEAFTAMRMRGANATDIAILVVAADDGVMPQTIEAINHAKAAGIQIIVAINKIDKPSANVERVKQELMEYELVAEDWGGSTVFVPVSAHTGEGIEQLLEMILLTAEICELKANPHRKARGIVIEAELDKGRGPVATILVQKGTMHIGDSVAIGSAYGKVRAMMDDKGRRVKEALPSTPIEILGLNEVPTAGEVFMAVDTDKEARSIAETYIKQSREKLLSDTKSKLSLDGLFSQIQAGNVKELNLVVKADVQGSVEAVKQSLIKLSNEEVAIRIIHGGVGAVNESDVILASASNAIIIGFNVRPDSAAKETAERENVDLRLYRVIYNAIEDIEAAMKGMLDPVFEEKVTGHAQVRQVFKASGLGSIAGSYVLDGKIVRGCKVRISREDTVIFDGELASLKRFKDDVKEVAAGYECGLVFDKFNDVIEEDMVEAYVMVEVPR